VKELESLLGKKGGFFREHGWEKKKSLQKFLERL